MKKHVKKTFLRLIKGALLSVMLFLSACSVEDAVDRVIDRIIARAFDLDDELSACLPETQAKPFADSAVDDLLNEGISFSASSSEAPYYRFSIDQPQAITITARGESADPSIVLFDSEGNTIEENDDFGDGYNSRIPMSEPLDPGTYCISVAALEDDDFPIDLSIKSFVEADLDSDNLNACLPDTEAKPFADSAVDDLLNEGISFSASSSEAPYYRFSIDQPQAITITARGESADPSIVLFDSEGNTIEENDDFGDGYNSRIPMSEPLDPGTYCISVAALEDNESPINLSLKTFVDTDLDNDNQTACLPTTEAKAVAESGVDQLLEEGLSFSASVSETPFYRFSIDSPQAITISAESESADPTLTLYDARGHDIAENDDYGDSYNSRLNFRKPLESGTYCIGVGAIESDSISIRTSIEAFDESAIDREAYDLVDEVPPLDGSYPISTFEYSGNRVNTNVALGEKAVWYRIDVTAPSIFFFEAKAIDNNGIDPELSLFNSDGDLLAHNDDGLDTDSLLAARLEPATYLLALSQAEDADSDLVQVLVERFAKMELE